MVVAALLIAGGTAVATANEPADATSTERAAVDATIASIHALVPGWGLPPAVTGPLEAGDLETAGQAATLVWSWVEAAHEADEGLPGMGALGRSRDGFERPETLDALGAGAARAQEWSEAAGWVRRSIDVARGPRDVLTTIGLLGVDVDDVVQDAEDAALAGDVEAAVNRAAEAVALVNGGADNGVRRLAGLVVLGFVVLGFAFWRRWRRGDPPPSGVGGPRQATSG